MIGEPRERVRRAVEQLKTPSALADGASPSTKIALRALYLSYRTAIAEGRPIPGVSETGFRVFSQADEDGIVLFLLAAAQVDRGRFVELGAGDCLAASNCANLALNLGFHGVFVDADAAKIEHGRRLYSTHPDTRAYPPRAIAAFLTRENVNDVVWRAGIEGELDVLSIDVDGNDYWLWEALTCVRPRIVVIEVHTEYRLHDVLAPYRAHFDWRQLPEGEPVGASPVAMTRLAERLGYRLVGGNRYGFNAFYLREDLGVDLVPSVGVEALLRHDWSREPNGWSEPPPD
jgi:hypothetical protein